MEKKERKSVPFRRRSERKNLRASLAKKKKKKTTVGPNEVGRNTII